MTNPWDKAPGDQLPKADLNPLMNPTLGQNLGKWAQVYFTSPPERREQAVVELLRELEGESPAGGAPKEGSTDRTADARAQLPKPVLCPGCRGENEANQRFCGICGVPLKTASPPQLPHRDEAFPASRIPARETPLSSENDVAWLRGKTLSVLDESEEPAHRKWTYVIVGLAIILAGFAGVQWLARAHPALASRWFGLVSGVAVKDAHQVQTAEPGQPAIQPPAREQTPADQQPPPVQPTAAAPKDVNQTPVRTSLPFPAAQVAPQPDPWLQGNGTQELLRAQRYLDGKRGSQDSAEAAKWLWKALSKQNTSAALLLADLYIRGDGVPKSCDQARLLLVAAAKKGAADAAQKLRSFESGGCR